MFRRPHWVALGVTLALVIVLWSLPESVAAKFRMAAGGVFVPFFGLAGATHSLAEKTSDTLMPRSTLLKEVRALREENRELKLQMVQVGESLRENARFRQFYGWQVRSAWKTRVARVVARDTANWWRTFRIDLGSKDGVRTDLPVLTPEGLVGKIGIVGYTSSQVLLVGDPKCRVSVLIRETGENGVISAGATGVLDHRLVDLTHLPRSTTPKPGQTVQSSGLGGIYPAGIPVGTIVDSRSVGFGLYTEARVKLNVDSSKLSEVILLFP
jgi:rod shape-determining protein MreC